MSSSVFKKILFQQKCNYKKTINENPFTFKKPNNWNYLALFEKIKYYGMILSKDYSIYVDKLNSKNIVEEICKNNNISNLYIPKVIKILNDINDLEKEDINSLYIIKGNHGSKYNINIKLEDEKEINDTNDIKDEKEDKFKNIIKQLTFWNKKYIGDEKQYDYIIPTFFLEEKIDDYYSGKSGHAATFMFRCIHGKPVSIGVSYRGKINNYFLDFSPIKIEITDININLNDIKNEFKQMYDLSCILSSKFEFVRIDFYLSKERKIYFSEFTFTPKAGVMNFPTYELEYELGKSWI